MLRSDIVKYLCNKNEYMFDKPYKPLKVQNMFNFYSYRHIANILDEKFFE